MAEKTTTIPLIRTKLHRPPIPVVHVHRPQLLQRLEKGHQGPLTLVSAPAGYVKNTLVSRWLEVCDCPNARLQLPENEKDLRLFLSDLLYVLKTVFHATVQKAQGMLHIIHIPPILLLWGIFSFISFLNVDVSFAQKPVLEPVTIQLRWFHQFQFAGYYAAIEKGFYAAEGLKVALRVFDSETGRVAPVLQGKAQYGVGDSGLLKIRAEGKPVVVLAQIFQHSSAVLLTRRSSGILSPDGLLGKKVMLPLDDLGDPAILTVPIRIR